MNNMRIVYDNALERAQLSASSEASAQMAAAKLRIDDKDTLWRATSNAATLTLTWSSAEVISCFALAFCNFSPVATIRVRGYSDAAGTVQVLDTGLQLACPAPAVRLRGWTAAQTASAYAYGGGAFARIWFPEVTVQRIIVDVADPGNLQGYLEAACLIVSRYISMRYNASDASLTPVDTTELYRKASGAQGADPGFTYRRLSIDQSKMLAADRAVFVNLLRNSRAYPVLISVFPGSQNLELERDNMVYGRRSKDSDIATQFALSYSTTIEIEEI